MKQAAIAAVILIACVVVSFAAGWTWRDDRAKADTAVRASEQQTQRADSAEQARVIDSRNAQAGAQAQQQRAESQARTEATFRPIENKATTYAQATSFSDGCHLDGDGLRAWREANAGTDGNAESGDTGRLADDKHATPTATGKR